VRKILLTLALLEKGNKILLGMKKRGFGVGRWNGFGGKVKEGEKIEEAVKRELKEEVGILAKRIEEKGVLNFVFDQNPEEILEVHLFKILDFEGEPRESEEMRPKWFEKEKIPFDQMWPDDKYWLPIFLNGKKLEGNFYFADNDKILDYKIKVI